MWLIYPLSARRSGWWVQAWVLSDFSSPWDGSKRASGRGSRGLGVLSSRGFPKPLTNPHQTLNSYHNKWGVNYRHAAVPAGVIWSCICKGARPSAWSIMWKSNCICVSSYFWSSFQSDLVTFTETDFMQSLTYNIQIKHNTQLKRSFKLLEIGWANSCSDSQQATLGHLHCTKSFWFLLRNPSF